MVGEAAELFKVLGVESRLKMLELLKQRGAIGAKEIARELGITVAAASQHLKILKHIGLVTSKRDGYFIPYSLDEAALEHCTMMMSSICSCPHHPPFRKKTDAEQNDLEHKSIDELKAYRNKLEQKLKRVNRLLNEMRSG